MSGAAADGRLNATQLAALPAIARQPAYDREAQRAGIVHFGIGAFHRAHQAVYTDNALAVGDRDWRIIGVSMRSPDIHTALAAQDGLYSLVERERVGERLRIIGAVKEVLVAPQNPQAVISALASPDTHVVSFTVTEKGYYRDATSGSLLTSSTALAHDLKGEGAPQTIYGFLAQALAQRRDAKLPGVTLLSCDNLAENGKQLEKLLTEFLHHRDPSLAAWVRDEVTCPSTMVDRIVPATTTTDLQRIANTLGMEDRGAVFTESFSQWVIEDRFAGPRPRWEAGGAQFTRDVRPFETAKLRMLNGAHSTLAYVGLALGLEYVHQAIADADLYALVKQLMVAEAAASLAPVAGQDLHQYAEALLQRFDNPSLAHRLSQIAMDGSQKISQRWLATLADLDRQEKPTPALLFALAAWIAYICTPNRVVDDPLATQLAGIRERSQGRADSAVIACVGETGLFGSTWHASKSSIVQLIRYVESISHSGMRYALQQLPHAVGRK
jgi:fructuronate reductase